MIQNIEKMTTDQVTDEEECITKGQGHQRLS